MEAQMTRVQEKAQGFTKRTVGQMIGDERLVSEGQQQVEHAEKKESADDQQADEHKPK
jgi:uncharacterized protein YjbJ (UPF0337 family)